MSMVWDCILWYYICGQLKRLILSRVIVHYRAEKKTQKGQLQADGFLVELIFILLSHLSQGDS